MTAQTSAGPQPVKLSGDLRDTPFAKIAGHLARSRATGMLEVNDAIGVNRGFFLDGAPQGAKLSRLKHPIGRILVDEGILGEDELNQALRTHNSGDKLLGQVLLDMKLLTQEQLDGVMGRQSQLNFLSLFALREGRYSFSEGLVNLTDFTAAPMVPLVTLYDGVREHSKPEVTYDLVADIAFSAVRIDADAQSLVTYLPPAEQMAVRLMQSYRFTGDLARSVPLPIKSLRSLLFALHQLQALEVAPAVNVPREERAAS